MTNPLFNAMKECRNSTTTTNGMSACRSTLSALLDLFSGGAALRKTPADVPQAVRAAYREDKLGTLRCLFYLRDIRGNGGQGEREVFRAGIRTVAELDTELFLRSGIIRHIPDYGRWDDLFALFGVSAALDSAIVSLVAEQLNADQTALAERLQIHQTTYSDYELGKLNIPVGILHKLADFYGVSVDYLIGRTNIKNPYPKK